GPRAPACWHAMIVTLTPNPSLDLLFTAERLVWDDANRIPMPRRRPGGQGINLVRAVRILAPDAATRAVAPLGGPVGRELRDMLDAEGTPLTAVPIAGESRVFVGVRESATGRSMLLNPRGPEITDDETGSLLGAVEAALELAARGPAWLVACGSLLPGLPADFYARVGRLARRQRARFVPDCDGPALAAAVGEADLLVPNALEAGRLVGRQLDSPEAAIDAARALRERGPDRVVVTLGADGAVAVDGAGAWRARPLPPKSAAELLARSSAVGAGDAFLAALILALDGGAATPDALADAVAAGTAVLLSEGAELLRREDAVEARGWVERVRV
ncbi:MAG: 1-phosphofructokinase family hexose kinase, partial [Candidatus Longimicrobiales bacterium M2_2A_002]